MKKLALLTVLAAGLLAALLFIDRDRGASTAARGAAKSPAETAEVPLATTAARDRLEGLVQENSPAQMTQVRGGTALLLTVSSSHGLPLTQAFVRSHGDSEWQTVVCDPDGSITHPGRADVKAPGHVASPVGAMDERVALVADGLLVLTAVGLRAATFGVKDGNLWVGGEEHAAMARTTSAGFIGPDQFAVAVTPRDWPNHNLRPEFDLELLGGPTVSVSFLPKTGERAFVDVVLEAGWCRDMRSTMYFDIHPSEVEEDESVKVQLRRCDDADEYLIFERRPWGAINAQVRFKLSVQTGKGPGPWMFNQAIRGGKYRASAVTGTGRYGVLDAVHDGTKHNFRLNDPSHVVGRLVGSNGESIESAEFHWSFDASDNAEPGASEWSSRTAANTPLELDSGRFDIPFPLHVPIFQDAALRMPELVTLTLRVPGFEAQTREVSLQAGRTTDLGDVLLPARKVALILNRPPDLEVLGQPLIEWKQEPDQNLVRARFEWAVDASTGDWRVYLVSAAHSDAAPPEFPASPPGLVFFALGRDAVGGVLTDSGTYDVVPPTRLEYDVEIGPFEGAVPSQVDLAISWRGFRRMVNSFWPDAFGTTRTLAWHMPEGELTFWWRCGQEAEWEALSPVAGDQTVDGVLKLTE